MNVFSIGFSPSKSSSVKPNRLQSQLIGFPQKNSGSKLCSATTFLTNPIKTSNSSDSISFKGAKTDLVSSFLKSENTNKIYQFLCNAPAASPTQVRKFLDTILSNAKHAKSFIQEITSEPRKSIEIVKSLTKKMGGEDKFRDWYVAENGYLDSFTNHIANDFYPNAKTESDMLAYMPNWVLHKTWEKASALGHDPIIGNLPNKFGDRNAFIQVVNKIHSLGVGEKCDFNIGKNYALEKISQNDKSTCLVTPEGSNLSYIIKIDNLHSSPIYDRMRPNSVYLESAVGHYLTEHNCNDAAKFYYYDLFHDAALFEFVKGDVPKYKNVIERNKETPDLLALGIFSNDIFPENYIKTAKGIKLIDFGHVTYFDRLKPGVMAHTIDLPNFAKPNFMFTYGLKDIEDFVLKAQKGNK